ncbi:MAG: carbohydrate kinase family protein [Rhodobacteraceae bacterium]|nr:carbohydrate kinase family protein [Paracoccaceae bacterium]
MPGPEILCAGMVVVDVLVRGVNGLPRMGETGFVHSITLATGGDAMNEAMALARLGNRVGLIGMVGDDTQGQFIRDQCLRAGVGVDGLFVKPGQATATGVVMIEDGGEHCFLTPHVRSHAELGPEHIDMSLIRPGLRALSIASLFTAERFDRLAVAELLKRAKSVGALTFADFVMDQQGYGLDDLAGIWPHLDWVLPSELEAQVLTGTRDPAAVAADFRRRGVRNVVLKRGAAGAVAFTEAGIFETPAFRVEVADTTGAGDNFVAGFIHGLVHAMPVPDALRFGAAVAALSVQAVGAGAGLKDLAQVEAFLAGR